MRMWIKIGWWFQLSASNTVWMDLNAVTPTWGTVHICFLIVCWAASLYSKKILLMCVIVAFYMWVMQRNKSWLNKVSSAAHTFFSTTIRICSDQQPPHTHTRTNTHINNISYMWKYSKMMTIHDNMTINIADHLQPHMCCHCLHIQCKQITQSMPTHKLCVSLFCWASFLFL